MSSKSIGGMSRTSMSQKSIRSNKSFAYDLDDDLPERDKRLTKVTSKAIRRFDRRGISNFTRLATGIASTVLSAYLGFKDPRRRRREYLIPKDKAAWLEWLVYVARRRINVEYLTDKELRKVIIRARPNLSPHKKSQEPVEDPDLPACIQWTEKQVGDWISSIGWPQLRETFVKNWINGRRLVLIDCTALNKMGMTDLAAMRDVAGKIRELLGTPPPNALRPIVRIPPYERFLHRKVYNGRTYDELTFAKFCDNEGFNYELIADNKNAQIPCTCEVLITTPEQAEADEDGEGDSDDEEHSLKNAPTVEYLVRNAIVRNKTVDQILSDILENVFLPPRERKYGKEVWGTLKRGIGEGYDDLHLYHPKDKLEFASGVAHHLIDELYKTVAILNDISQLEKHIKEDVSPDDMKIFQDGAMILMEEAAPIAALLALGELELESIFKKEPTFELYVDEVIREAEKRTNVLVPDARQFVDEVIAEAWRKIPDIDLKELDPTLRHSILRMANEILFGITEDSDDIVASVMNAAGGKRDHLDSPVQKVGIASGGPKKDVKIAPKPTQGIMKRKQSQPQGQGHPHPPGQPHATSAKTRVSVSQPPAPPETDMETGDETTTATEKPSTVSHKSEPSAVSHRLSESRGRKQSTSGTHPPATGESGSGSDNKDGDQSKQTKGKGKKHHGEKDKTKKDGQEQPPAGGGEGEGAPSMVEVEAAEPEQSVVVNVLHTAAVELDLTSTLKGLAAGDHSHPTTPARLHTAERRDSPLLRSPMTVTTPTADHGRDSPIPRSPMTLGTSGRLGTGRASFASSDDGEMPLQKKIETQAPVIHAEVIPHKAPVIVGSVKPTTTAYQAEQKIRRMSTVQDRHPRPLLETMGGRGEDIGIPIETQGQAPKSDLVSKRQGKSLPPSQQNYNQQQQVIEQQRQRIQQDQAQGKEPRPTAYHQKRGVVVKGQKDTTPKFGEIFEPEDPMPPVHRQIEHVKDNAPKAAKKTNFVLIPKGLKEEQQKRKDILLPPIVQDHIDKQQQKHLEKHEQKQKEEMQLQQHYQIRQVPPSSKSGVRASSTGTDLEVPKKGGQTPDQQSRSQSVISEGAQQIWQQMKEQYESRKSVSAEEKKQQTSKDGINEEKVTGEEESKDEGSHSPHDDPQHPKPRKSHAGPHAPELIIDHQHVLEMKEHRDTMVEDWAKKHSIMDPLDPSVDNEEKTRLVRMTADKVVTEICTMALTHLLLEAEAGKNTDRIMNTLKKMQVKKDAPHEGEKEITLWKTQMSGSKQVTTKQPTFDATATKKEEPTQGRKSNQSDGSAGKIQSGQKPQEQPQQTSSRSDSVLPKDKSKLRSILHIPGSGSVAEGGGADKLKAQAKSVVVNAVKSAYEDSGKSKPLSRSGSTSTAIRKDQYVTRL